MTCICDKYRRAFLKMKELFYHLMETESNGNKSTVWFFFLADSFWLRAFSWQINYFVKFKTLSFPFHNRSRNFIFIQHCSISYNWIVTVWECALYLVFLYKIRKKEKSRTSCYLQYFQNIYVFTFSKLNNFQP